MKGEWRQEGGEGYPRTGGELQGSWVTGGVAGGGVLEAPPATAFGSEWRF